MSSGIADYAAELLPWLAAEGLEPTLFYEGREAPATLPSEFPCRPVDELESAQGFDVVLYQLGNSAPHHATITDWANVVTVRMHILARNTRETGGHKDEKTYNLGPVVVGPFNDKYRRHVYSEMIRLMNVSGRRET